MIGKKRKSFQLNLKDAIGEHYGTTFRLVQHDGKKSYTLEKINLSEMSEEIILPGRY